MHSFLVLGAPSFRGETRGVETLMYTGDEFFYVAGEGISGGSTVIALSVEDHDKQIVESLPRYFRDDATVSVYYGAEGAIGVGRELMFNVAEGINLFSGMTAERFSRLLDEYLEFTETNNVADFDEMVAAMGFALMNPGKMSEYKNHYVKTIETVGGMHKLAELFPDYDIEFLCEMVLEMPDLLRNEEYKCYSVGGEKNKLAVFKRGNWNG